MNYAPMAEKNNLRRRKWKKSGGKYRELKKPQSEYLGVSCTNSEIKVYFIV